MAYNGPPPKGIRMPSWVSPPPPPPKKCFHDPVSAKLTELDSYKQQECDSFWGGAFIVGLVWWLFS